MIADRFATSDFAIGLCVRHPRFDFVQNLFFGESGIFQARNLRSAKRRIALQAALQNKLDKIIGETDKPESNRIPAYDIELIRSRHVKNLRLGVAGTGEIGGRFAAHEGMLSLVSCGHQCDTSIVAEPGLLDLHELRDFGIGRIQRFELFEAAGPHAGSIEGAVVRQNMLLAAANEKDTDTDKQG
jgi:hypothetical protein